VSELSGSSDYFPSNDFTWISLPATVFCFLVLRFPAGQLELMKNLYPGTSLYINMEKNKMYLASEKGG